MAGLTTVVLVDDHPLITDGLRAAIDADPELKVVGVARTVADARELLGRLRPSVAVIDIRLPDGTGFDLIDRAASTGWLLLSSFGSSQYVQAATDAGARGFFLKSNPTPVLVDAVKRVARDEPAYDPSLLEVALTARRWRPLSEREQDVVRQVLQGRSNDEIAGVLGISPKTVETHLTRLYDRFAVSSRTELALRAEREGWLDVPAR
jgi:DNA-binding NarL/FixJ family response regulator